MREDIAAENFDKGEEHFGTLGQFIRGRGVGSSNSVQ